MIKVKCLLCKKKIKKIIPISCKCKNFYCDLHKNPYDHNCLYDYKNTYKKKLEEENTIIKSSKFEKI